MGRVPKKIENVGLRKEKHLVPVPVKGQKISALYRNP